MELYKILDGVNMYYLKDDKYKTASLCISLKSKLERDNITKNALLAKVLRRGTKRLNTIEKINPYLEQLYGARYDVFSSKKANLMFLNCAVTAVSDMYTHTECVLDTAKLMLEFIYEPFMPDGFLDKNYVESEKTNLKDDIEATINDKRAFATQRCIDIMCEGEWASIHDNGYKEDLKDINFKNLTEYYKNLVKTSSVDIFVLGSVEIDGIKDMFENYFKNLKLDCADEHLETSKKQAGDIKVFNEPMDVNQGKLAIGLRTETVALDDDYFALLTGNSILGAGAHSKLFLNVREKMSLCYYVYSRIDKLSGLMLIGAGIEFDKYKDTVDAINEQIDSVKSGDYTDTQMDIAKKYLINVFKSYNDSQFALRDYYYTNALCGQDITIENAIEKVKAVTREDINRVFKKIKTDTVYFLKGRD